MATSSDLLHPIRLRIVQTLLGEEELTTIQMHEQMPDVPIATLYRHVAQLVKHGLLEVVGERQIRGASERTYRVAPGLVNPSQGELAALSREDLLTMFTVFSSGLIRDFATYVQAGDPDLAADRVSFAQADFWATTAEVDEFLHAVMGALTPLLSNTAGGGRRRRKLTTVLVPRAESDVLSSSSSTDRKNP